MGDDSEKKDPVLEFMGKAMRAVADRHFRDFEDLMFAGLKAPVLPADYWALDFGGDRVHTTHSAEPVKLQYDWVKPSPAEPLKITPPTIIFRSVDVRWSSVRIRFDVNDRTNQSAPLELTYQENVPWDWNQLPQAERVAWIRQRMICVATHEIDEALFVSGLAPDPHLEPIRCEGEV